MLYATGVTKGLLLLAMVTACQPEPQELSQADKDAVKAQIEMYRQAALKADWDAFGNTLVTDVVLSPPNMAVVTGRDSVVAWAKAFPKITGFTLTVDELTGRGDLAYARGTFGLELALPDGSTGADRGSFLEIHRRAADGSWPYTRLMFHSTEPLPVAPPAVKR